MLYPDVGATVVIVGVGFVTVKASVTAATEPSVFRTVRLYRPIGSPVRGSEHLICEAAIDVGVTVLIAVLFVIVTVAPDLKLVPVNRERGVQPCSPLKPALNL